MPCGQRQWTHTIHIRRLGKRWLDPRCRGHSSHAPKVEQPRQQQCQQSRGGYLSKRQTAQFAWPSLATLNRYHSSTALIDSTGNPRELISDAAKRRPPKLGFKRPLTKTSRDDWWFAHRAKLLRSASPPFSPATWHQIDKSIFHLPTNGDAQSNQQGWQLLDRLLQDRQACPRADFRTIPPQLLGWVTHTWRICWEKQQESSDVRLLSPPAVLQRLMKCVETGLCPEPHHAAYGMVLDALLRNHVRRTGKKPRAGTENPGLPQIESVLDQLLLQLRRHYFQLASGASQSKYAADKFPLPTAVLSPVAFYWSKSGHVQAVQHVENYLRELKTMFEQTRPSDFAEIYRPDERMYSFVVSTLVKDATRSPEPSGSRPDDMKAARRLRLHAARRAGELLVEAQQHGAANIFVYNTVLDAWSKAGQAKEARALFDSMLSASLSNVEPSSSIPHPDSYSLSAVLMAYSMAKQPKELQNFLQSMEDSYENHGQLSLRPNLNCYNILLRSYASSSSSNPRDAQAILRYMEQLSWSSRPELRPDVVSFNHVLNSWARSGDPSAATHATTLFLEMKAAAAASSASGIGSEPRSHKEPHHDSRTRSVKPDLWSHNILFECYALCSNVTKEQVSLALSLLSEMEESCDPSLRPDAFSYNTVIRILRNVKQPQNAQDVLRKLCHSYQTAPSKKGQVVPNIKLFTSVIASWATSGSKEATTQIESLLKEMSRYHLAGLPVRPNRVSYNAFLDCLSRSDELEAPHKAEEILRRMLLESEGSATDEVRGFDVRPDVISYTSCIAAWSRSTDPSACTHVESLLKEMKDAGIDPNPHTYNLVMTTYARARRPFKVESTFNEAVADFRRRQQHRGVNALTEDDQLSSHMHITLLNAWANAGDPERAALVLEMLIDAYEKGITKEPPDRRHFGMVVRAWAASNRPDAAERAEQGLLRMEELDKTGRFACVVGPDLYTYSCVITAYLQRKGDGTFSGGSAEDETSAHHAHRILLALLEKYKSSRDPVLRPDLRVYTYVIRSLALRPDNDPNICDHVDELIASMGSFVTPDSWKSQSARSCPLILDALLASPNGEVRRHCTSKMLPLMSRHRDDLDEATRLKLDHLLDHSLADNIEVV
jgi:pentatricopeptide repeat protein